MLKVCAAAVLAGACAAGCGDQSGAPTSPSEAVPAAGNPAGADGTTLKVSAPVPASPAEGAAVRSLRPVLVVTGATARFEAANQPQLRYRFQVLTNKNGPVREALVGGTSWQVPTGLRHATTYHWRVRAEAGGAFGPWSALQSFRTPNVPPGRALPPGPYPRSGPGVASYVSRHWPEKLKARTGMAQRTRNMEFLRDRMIEVARCGGLDVAWNKKRGVGPHSHDAIAWRTRGRVEVVDIALAFKDPSKPLRLHWNITSGPSGYDRYRNAFYCR